MKAGKHRGWLSFVCVSNLILLACQTANAASDSGTLTVTSPGCGYVGYADEWNHSSYSPAGLSGSTVVAAVYDYIDEGWKCPLGPGTWSLLKISGFSSDPGAGWLNSVTCNGVTKHPTDAAYDYRNGIASWNWVSIFVFLSAISDGNTTCTIDHN